MTTDSYNSVFPTPPVRQKENHTLQRLLAVCGILGICSFYVLQEQSKNQGEGLRQGIVTTMPSAPESVKENAAMLAAPIEKVPQKVLLKKEITGVGEVSTFDLLPLANGNKYTIEFGDGIVETINGSQATHIYKTSGWKTVVLKASFNGQETVLQTLKIPIAGEIEVDESVKAIDNSPRK